MTTLHARDLYLPAPCYGLTDNTIAAVLNEFHTELKNKLDCDECILEDTFLRCPRVAASARLFSELNVRDYYHK